MADEVEQLDRSLGRVRRLREACHRWLQHPDDPQLYCVEPRAREIEVVYEEPDEEGRMVRRRGSLQKLLLMLQHRVEVRSVEARHADPRELLLRAAAEERRLAQTLLELQALKREADALAALRRELMEALEGVSPDLARRVARAVTGATRKYGPEREDE